MHELIAGLSKPFPRQAIKQREGAFGKMLDYVEAETVIRRLNAVCPQWSFRMTGHEWTEPVEWTDKNGKPRTSRTLIVWGELEVPGVGVRSGTGVQVVDERSGEDLIKGALSDCLKNAAKHFNVAIDLYGPDLEAGEIATTNQERPGRQEANRAARDDIREHNNAQIAPQAPRPLPPSKPDYEQRSPSVLPPIQPGGAVSDTLATSAQLKAIEDIGGRLGLAFADIDKIAQATIGRPLDGIQNRQASRLITHLQTLQRSGGQGDLGLKPAAMAAQ